MPVAIMGPDVDREADLARPACADRPHCSAGGSLMLSTRSLYRQQQDRKTLKRINLLIFFW